MNMVILFILLLAMVGDIRGCVCDPGQPASMEGRECALTRIALAEKSDAPVVIVHDSSPTKPNRWLALPHSAHRVLDDMTPPERAAYWTAAIAKAHELWGEDWGIAVNGEEKRSQCQMHAHIGKLLPDVDRTGGELVDGPAAIPLPPPGTGLWITPEGAKLRVHVGTLANETNLMR